RLAPRWGPAYLAELPTLQRTPHPVRDICFTPNSRPIARGGSTVEINHDPTIKVMQQLLHAGTWRCHRREPSAAPTPPALL
ncbi:MAG: hypothetical protein V3T55_10950, partial [Anaerolineales bacterium]